MSTLALLAPLSAGPAATERPAKAVKGLFRRLLAAREAEARQRTVLYLAWQPEDRLTALGYTADDIAALRKGEFRLPSNTQPQ